MKRAAALVAAPLLAFAAGALLAEPPAHNLIANGDFETAAGDHPAHWQQAEGEDEITTRKKEFLNGPPVRIFLDGLTCFWVADPLGKSGKCLKQDSDVLLTEFRARRDEMRLPQPPPARPKTPTRPPKYDTVGGSEGVHFYSDFVDVKPDTRYALSVDYLMGENAGAPKLWIKAYRDMDGWKRVAFKKYLDLKGGSRTAWKHYETSFNPTKLDREHAIHWMRVDLYAYWPAGTYYFDNVRLVEVGPEPPAPPRPDADGDDEDDE